MSAQPPERKPNCNACAHFYITHDPAFPYACRRLGFRSKRLPARDVEESSGMACLVFEAKEKGRSAG
ncbi:hypothetical protein E6C76_08360 [Pseudothauera nasutitermitis]|uniref:Uracil-DNA glycosylase n=1 Tax=Pseudothauera nasutitermitis TaxID=2565930 RepID=A0A4S4B0N6_9RHOO|nr:hypothetical protein [Pseudothauera nasutitermitis]THF65582.1 hypothetical protein E6C76_08360 [Pseudothauera nasutitermitis]